MLKAAAVLATVLLSAGAAWAGPEASEAAALSGPVSVGLLGAALVGAGLATRPRRGGWAA